jgi:hypothetical protein
MVGKGCNAMLSERRAGGTIDLYGVFHGQDGLSAVLRVERISIANCSFEVGDFSDVAASAGTFSSDALIRQLTSEVLALSPQVAFVMIVHLPAPVRVVAGWIIARSRAPGPVRTRIAPDTPRRLRGTPYGCLGSEG